MIPPAEGTAPMSNMVSVPREMPRIEYVTQEEKPSHTTAAESIPAGWSEVPTETRKVSSVIVEQQYLGELPVQEGGVRVVEVEVPIIEEQVKYVKKKEVREKVVEVRVPIVEYVDRIVEVKVPVYEEKLVEKIQYVDVYVDEPEITYVDEPVYVNRPKPVVREKIIEKVVQVPVKRYVPRRVVKEVAKPQLKVVESQQPVIVAQTIKPIIVETNKQMVVDVCDFEPEVVPVDVHVAKPVSSALELVGQTSHRHRLVNISSSQYNSMLRQMNSHVEEQFKHALPYVKEGGQISFVDEKSISYIIAPEHIQIDGYKPRPPVSRTIGTSGAVETTTEIIQSVQQQPSHQHQTTTLSTNQGYTKEMNLTGSYTSTGEQKHSSSMHRIVPTTTHQLGGDSIEQQRTTTTTMTSGQQATTSGVTTTYSTGATNSYTLEGGVQAIGSLATAGGTIPTSGAYQSSAMTIQPSNYPVSSSHLSTNVTSQVTTTDNSKMVSSHQTTTTSSIPNTSHVQSTVGALRAAPVLA